MSCFAKCLNTLAGLDLETWSGTDKENGQPKLICTIDDKTDAKHFVEVMNVKTYARRVDITANIIQPNGSAIFTGHSSGNGHQWVISDTLFGTSGIDTLSCGFVQIAKANKGTETIEVVVEYQDIWSPKQTIRADVPSQPLVFKITVK